jgi:hypothetical protein
VDELINTRDELCRLLNSNEEFQIPNDMSESIAFLTLLIDSHSSWKKNVIEARKNRIPILFISIHTYIDGVSSSLSSKDEIEAVLVTCTQFLSQFRTTSNFPSVLNLMQCQRRLTSQYTYDVLTEVYIEEYQQLSQGRD